MFKLTVERQLWYCSIVISCWILGGASEIANGGLVPAVMVVLLVKRKNKNQRLHSKKCVMWILRRDMRDEKTNGVTVYQNVADGVEL